jgi:hypothetical protein
LIGFKSFEYNLFPAAWYALEGGVDGATLPDPA